MKKTLALVLALSLSVFLAGCTTAQLGLGAEAQKQVQESQNQDAEAVKNLVEEFGRKLQLVSLLAPEDVLKGSMEESYAEFVSPSLLEQWLQDPINAPGRLTSSPWPDRIEIISMEKIAEEAYEVKGEIIEITSASDAAAGKKPIVLVVEKTEGKWLISQAQVGEAREKASVVYHNTRYGFTFSLPESWQDYRIITDEWEAFSLAEAKQGEVVERGPVISIRHPQWTEEEPRQDIPIMIFTLEQWEGLEEGAFSLGAAPVGPTELGRNSQYVFALPARYNYAFPTGYEEVEEILAGHPLSANENFQIQ